MLELLKEQMVVSSSYSCHPQGWRDKGKDTFLRHPSKRGTTGAKWQSMELLVTVESVL